MASFAFPAPVRPGQTDHLRQFIDEMRRRSDEHAASRRRAGITVERAWLHETPMGPLVVVYVEGEDLGSFFKRAAESDDPFDRWFIEQIGQIHGIDPSQPPPDAEQIFDWHA